jgi:hypothetical protein
LKATPNALKVVDECVKIGDNIVAIADSPDRKKGAYNTKGVPRYSKLLGILE